MKIINKYNQDILIELNKVLELDIPLDPEKFLTTFNMYPDYPISDRMDMILDDFPNMPTIFLHCKRNEYGEYNQQMFPSDWKRIVRLLKDDRHVIWFISPEDYIQVAPGFNIIKRKGNYGVSNIIWKIIQNLKNPNRESVMDINLLQYYMAKGYSRIKAYEKLGYINDLLAPTRNKKDTDQEYKIKIKSSFQFKGRIDIIFNGLDIDSLDVVRDLRDYTERDLYKMKYLYLLYFQDNPTYMMIKEFRGISTANTFESTELQHNPRQQAEDFVESCLKLLKVKIDIDKIYTDIEEIPLSSDFMDTLFGYDDDGELIVKNTTLTQQSEDE